MELAIVSGKGGTGKSSITAALAVMKQKLLLADCDVDAANLYLLFQPEKNPRASLCFGPHSNHRQGFLYQLRTLYGLLPFRYHTPDGGRSTNFRDFLRRMFSLFPDLP